jgi:GT2 family glycosyltransferase/glycosyltransferase involved in cell wall biosynthesis
MPNLLLEMLASSGLFDPEWYARTYPDVALSGLDPAEHYIHLGVVVGRPPRALNDQNPPAQLVNHPRFSLEAYRLANPRVPKNAQAALLHRMLACGSEDLITNWLDYYLHNQIGNTERLHVSSLIDLVVMAQKPGAEPQALTARLSRLQERLISATERHALRGTAPTPKVSVIVPVFNQVTYTIGCVASLFESNPACTFEVIIADDCSTDETHSIFCRLQGAVKVARTTGNLGFLRNCNNAVRCAQGDYLLFLNNDTIVLPGCLDKLLDVLGERSCGAAGAKLINLDGTLQEAGGVLWRDFEGWNYGRGANPADPAYDYRRSVDYCSGACLMVPRAIFEKLGGFSDELEMAYGEDSDLCMSIRHKLGLDVVYEPKACVIHFEGKSCGTSLETGIKRYQVVNKQKLATKWKPVTDTFTPPNKEHAQIGPRRHMGWPRVCLVDHYIPRFDRESGSRRLMTILEILKSMGCHVYFLAENLHPEQPYADAVRSMGVELLVGATGFGATCEQLFTERRSVIDLVWCVRPYTTERWLHFFRKLDPKIRVVFDTGDIHHLRMRAEEELAGTFRSGQSESEVMRTREEKLCREADVTVAVSPDDAETLLALGATRVEVVSGIYNDCTGLDNLGFAERSGILFVGGGHAPNTDGLLWFLKDVWPLLRESNPDLKVDIVGDLGEKVRGAAGEGVRVAGHVPDVAPFFRRARIFICPLRFGAGIKGKLGQCVEYGLPFVTTSVGAAGMNFVHKKDALICDTAAEFARCVAKLNRDSDLWELLRRNLVQHLEVYSPAKARKGLENILATVPGFRPANEL